MPFAEWKAELLRVGNIVQDEDQSVVPAEKERRFNRYMEMLERLDGSENDQYAAAVMTSIQAHNDYGAYQAAVRALWRFGVRIYCKTLLDQLLRLIQTLPDWAGDFLGQIANEDTSGESAIHEFNQLLSALPADQRSLIQQFIASQESDSWLEHRVGVLGVKV